MVVIAVMSSIGIFGCEEERTWSDPGPASTFERFLMDWYRGEYEAAFETIAPEDRKALTEPLDELEGKLDAGDLPKEADMLVVGRVDNPFDIKDIDLEDPLESAPQKGQKVTLELLYHDGRQGKATMIWGGERWYVDLPLEDQAGPPAQQNTDDRQQDPDLRQKDEAQ